MGAILWPPGLHHDPGAASGANGRGGGDPVFGRRLGWGRGFEVEIARLPEPFTGDKTTDGAKLNQAVEQLIRQAPAQYLWSYNRYKTPAGVAPAETPNP